jgi:hypothetical protein
MKTKRISDQHAQLRHDSVAAWGNASQNPKAEAPIGQTENWPNWLNKLIIGLGFGCRFG